MKVVTAILLLVVSCSGIKAKHHKNRDTLAFPATHDSLLIENAMANEEHLVRFQDIQDLRSLEPLLHNRTVAIESHLPANRRLCRPEVNQFLYALGTAHQMFSPSPIWVSSAVRPVQVQRRLHLRNAAPWKGDRASPHETGATVDLKRQGRADDAWMVAYFSAASTAGRIHVIEERNCWHIFVRRITWTLEEK